MKYMDHINDGQLLISIGGIKSTDLRVIETRGLCNGYVKTCLNCCSQTHANINKKDNGERKRLRSVSDCSDNRYQSSIWLIKGDMSKRWLPRIILILCVLAPFCIG